MIKFIKALSLIAAAVITFVLVISFEQDEETISIYPMSESTLPVVYMLDGDTRYNQLYGYTGDVDGYAACENVTILPEDRRLGISIDKYNSSILGIAYEVRSLDGSNLYEDTVVNEYSDEGGSIRATLIVKNLLDKDKDYILKVKLRTANFDEVAFYTILRYDEAALITKKIGLVKEFSDYTFDKSKMGTIKKYIETDDSVLNNDYSYVNIHSSAEMFVYNDLDVVRTSEPVAFIEEIHGEDAIIWLTFNAKASFNGATSEFTVKERYTMTESKTGMYLMDYERFLTEEYRIVGSVKSTSRIYTGIAYDKNNSVMRDEKEDLTVYSVNGNLYMYNIEDNILSTIFSFGKGERDNVREDNSAHNIKVLSVSKEGEVIFAIYGYMNNGLHEGKTGVSICRYKDEDKKCEEIKFISVPLPYSKMDDKVLELAYVNENKSVTVFILGDLFTIDTKSQENTVVIGDLKEGEYAVSEENMKISYVRDNILRIYDVKSSKIDSITPAEDEIIKCVGYIGKDFIYGIAKKADIFYEVDGKEVVPMYKLFILDENLELIKEYGIENCYVTNTWVDGGRVNLERIRKLLDGSFVLETNDQIMNRTDNQNHQNRIVSTVATEERLTENVIKLDGTVSDARKVKYSIVKTVSFNEDIDENSVEVDCDDTQRYITKAYMMYKCYPQSKAMEIPEDKGYEDELLSCIDIILLKLGRNEDVLSRVMLGENMSDILNDNGICLIDLKERELEDILGFTKLGNFVLVKVDKNSYGLICGYNKTEVAVYLPSDDKVHYYSKEEFELMTAKCGDFYYTCVAK